MLKPRARTFGLIVQDLDGEVLVYDTDRHRAHCLNRTAGLVWRWSDGETSLPDMARRLGEMLDLEKDATPLVLDALRRLGKAHLLDGPADLPQPDTRSRRDALRTLACAASLLPVVATIVAPHAAEAATCTPIDGPCSSPAQCCPNRQNVRCCRNGQCANGVGNCI